MKDNERQIKTEEYNKRQTKDYERQRKPQKDK